MGKYDPLTRYLAGRTTTEVPMTFDEIEKVLGVRLPASKQYPAWWSNNPSNNVMTRAWLAAGFQTERVDPARERLVFRRRSTNPGAGAPTSPGTQDGGFMDRLRARLSGTITIPEGVDPTAPTRERWDSDQ